ncbi:MAG: zinc-binding dehydrogenase [Deltaproteobacteria bacterium]|nr:zinc-binding dehydrogenase [Deltaproteobacteria bacterium]
MFRKALYFLGPAQVEVREEPLPRPGPEQVLVKTMVSAISPGTELLIYRNEFPPEVPVDATIPALAGSFRYPLKYGYAAVGEVVEVGSQIAGEWLGRLIFAFHPHESHFVAYPEELLPLPRGMSPEVAALLPNMETAVTLMLDGAPLLGEQVVVFGQGIVGLLLTALLAKMPLTSLVTLDPLAHRRSASLSLGAHHSLDPREAQLPANLLSLLRDSRFYAGADLTYEVSGQPSALDQAIAIAGYHSRIVVGSWYGRKKAALNLGGVFHRSRIRLVSSQVSSIAPELTGRWPKPRLLNCAWRLLQESNLKLLITHTFNLAEAASAYDMLDKNPQQAIQVILQY